MDINMFFNEVHHVLYTVRVIFKSLKLKQMISNKCVENAALEDFFFNASFSNKINCTKQ